MSKIDEVIEMLYHVLKNESWNVGVNDLKVVETYDLKPVLEALVELNKPPQYTVEMLKEGGKFTTLYGYRLNDMDAPFLFGTPEETKISVLTRLNESAKTLALPPITIEQIIFVEL